MKHDKIKKSISMMLALGMTLTVAGEPAQATEVGAGEVSQVAVPAPTEVPEPTQASTEAPVAKPVERTVSDIMPVTESAETPADAETQTPTAEPVKATEAPTAEPVNITEAPVVTEAPEDTASPENTETAAPTVVPEATASAEQTETPAVSVSPEPSENPENTVSPEPTMDPEVSVSPELTMNPEASVSSDPSMNPEATVSPEPTMDPEASVSAEPSMDPVAVFGDGASAVQTITAYAPLNINAVAEVYKKPALEAVLALLPGTISATVAVAAPANVEGTENSPADGENPSEMTVEVPIVWHCLGYGDQSEGSFVFTSALDTEDYQLAEHLKMPSFTLVVLETTMMGAFECGMTAQGTVVIVSWTGEDEQLVVPETIKIAEGEAEGYLVTGIDARAFSNRENLKSVELPPSVRTIGDKAFEECKNLEKVIVTDALETVGEAIFKDCPMMTTLELHTYQDTILRYPDTLEHQAVAMPTVFLAAAISGENEAQPPAEEEEHTAKMPMAFTDIVVRAESLTVACDYTVAAQHRLTVEAGAGLEVQEGAKIINLGTIANRGQMVNYGTVYNCGGLWEGTAIDNMENGAWMADHSYENHVCSICGAREVLPVTKLTIKYNGTGLTKVYDKTRNVSLKSSNFTISGVAKGHSVRISGLTASYDSPAVGERTVTVGFTLGGADAAFYSCDGLTIAATITPKPLIITPSQDQKKVYGGADPSYFTGKVKGLLSGDKLTGRLGRDPGEAVGQYRITQGTLSGGDNYAIEVVETYFTIEPRSINSTEVALTSIANQRYTGKPIQPDVVLRYNGNILVKGVDYTVEYANNQQAGTATVTISGMGNFNGTRTANFRILNVSAGTDYGNGSTGGGSSTGSGGSGSFGGYDYDDFYDDDASYGYSGSYDSFDGFDDYDFEDYEYGDEEDVGDEYPVGSLMIDEVDWGTILFNELFEARPFLQIDEVIEDYEDVLADFEDFGEGTDSEVDVQDEPIESETSNESDEEFVGLYDEVESDNERWRLRIIPETAYDETAGDYVYLSDDREAYEQLHLRLTVDMVNRLVEYGYEELYYELEDAILVVPLRALEEELPRKGLQEDGNVLIETYDFCLEQVDLEALSDAEQAALADGEMIANAYRLRIIGEYTDDQGQSAEQDVMDLIQGVRLCVMPFEDLEDDGEYMAIQVPEDLLAMESQMALAEYTDIDECIYVQCIPEISGFYAWKRI